MNIKKLSLICFLIVTAKMSHSATPVAEAPIKDFGTPVTVTVTTQTTMTMLPTSQTVGRIGIFIDNPTSNGSAVSGFFGNCTSTSIASTIRPIEIAPGTNSTYFGIRDDVCLWLISLAAGSQSVHYQEVKQ